MVNRSQTLIELLIPDVEWYLHLVRMMDTLGGGDQQLGDNSLKQHGIRYHPYSTEDDLPCSITQSEHYHVLV